jgi:hypothetical protein
MTLRDALFPWATPARVFVFLVALAVCWLYGGTADGFALAIDPITLGTLMAVYAGGKLLGGIGKAAGAGARLKGLKEFEEGALYQQQQRLGRRAGEQLERGEFGPAEATKRAQLGEIIRAHEGSTAQAREQARRDIAAQGGVARSGRAQAALRDIIEGGRASTVAAGAGQIEQAAAAQALGEKAAAQQAMGSALAQQAQLAQAKGGAKSDIWSGALGGVGEAGASVSQLAVQQGAYQGYVAPEVQAAEVFASRVPGGSGS